MDAIEREDTARTSDADQPDVPIDQPEPAVYLPGTPTVSFVEYLEVAVRTLFR